MKLIINVLTSDVSITCTGPINGDILTLSSMKSIPSTIIALSLGLVTYFSGTLFLPDVALRKLRKNGFQSSHFGLFHEYIF